MTDTNNIEVLRSALVRIAMGESDAQKIADDAIATTRALSARASAGEGVSPLTLAVVGRKHFGNPIPQEWYAAARELLAAAPRAAEAMTEEMVERMVTAFGREPNWSMLNVEAKRAKARRYLTAALTPPSAKGE